MKFKLAEEHPSHKVQETDNSSSRGSGQGERISFHWYETQIKKKIQPPNKKDLSEIEYLNVPS